MKVSNSNARSAVQKKLSFTGNNTFGEYLSGAYVVFSYGYHWPMFAYIDGTWFENDGRYSRTTSKHRSQLHPLEDTEKVSTEELLELVGL